MTSVLTIQVKRAFFDRQAVLKRVDRARRRSLARVGGFTRSTAKRSIRKRKASSSPGQPPSSHSGELRGGIFFAYEDRSDSVVIGPVGFARSNVPGILEFGGKTTIRQTRLKRAGRPKVQRISIKARPFMGPALVKTSDRLPDAFATAMRR
jgi:phage gpG-like protein